MDYLLSAIRYSCFLVAFISGIISTLAPKLHRVDFGGEKVSGWDGLTRLGKLAMSLMIASFLLGVSLQLVSDVSEGYKANAKEKQERARFEAFNRPLDSVIFQVKIILIGGASDRTLSKFANAWTDELPDYESVQKSPLIKGLQDASYTLGFGDLVKSKGVETYEVGYFPYGNLASWMNREKKDGNSARLTISDDEIAFVATYSFVENKVQCLNEDILSVKDFEGKICTVQIDNLPKFYFEDRLEKKEGFLRDMDASFTVVSKRRGEIWHCAKPKIKIDIHGEFATMRLQSTVPAISDW